MVTSQYFSTYSSDFTTTDSSNSMTNSVIADNSTSNLTDCWVKFDFLKWTLLGGIASLPTTVLLSFAMRRNKTCLNCCGGRPGIAYPWNSLTYTNGRALSVLAITLISYPIFLILSNSTYIFQSIPPQLHWLIGPAKIAAILVVGLSLHPIFFTVIHPTLVTGIMALLMAIFHTTIAAFPLVFCSHNDNNTIVAMNILFVLPNIIAGSLLVVVLLFRIYKFSGKTVKLNVDGESDIDDDYILSKENYVRNVLKFAKVAEKSSVEKLGDDDDLEASSKLGTVKLTLKELWERYRYKNVEGFYYPLTFLCSMAASFILIYFMTMLSIYTVLATEATLNAGWVIPAVNKLNDTRTIEEVFANCTVDGYLNWSSIFNGVNGIRIAAYLLDNLVQILIIAICLSTINAIAVIGIIIFSYRRNVLNAYSGRYPNLILPSEQIASNWVSGLCRYGGYQVGYIAWSMLLQYIMYSLVMSFIWYTMLLPIVYKFDIWFTNFILRLWPTIIITLFIGWAQSNVPHYLFVAGKGNKLAIKRRKSFFVWSYYSFILSTVTGLLSCLLRLTKSFLVAFVFLAKLDTCSFPARFRFLDGGHLAYMGLLHTDVCHSHPMVVVFANLLLQSSRNKRNQLDCRMLLRESESQQSTLNENSSDYGSIHSITASDCALVKLQIRTSRGRCFSGNVRMKWYLAYTLIRNPMFMQTRRSNKSVIARSVITVDTSLGTNDL